MIQEQVLNRILAEKDSSIITLNNLTDEYFSDYKDEYWFIRNHVNQYGNVPDMETFLSSFPDFDVIKVNEPTNYLLEELTKDRNKRFLAENFNKIRTLLMNNQVDDAMELLREANEKSGQAVSLQCVDLIRDHSRLNSYIEKTENLSKYFVKTGFRELDAILGGWDVNEDLVTIAARNGLGKTWALLKCAAAAAQDGKRVGIYSGEMSEDTIGYRIDSILGHISNGALIHGGASVRNSYKTYLDHLDENVGGCIMVLTPKMINGSAGVSALRAFVEKYNIEILFVDQHSLLADDRKAKNPVEKAANISTDLKMLQTIKRIPIICVCQQNREKLESGFDTTQLAQSDKIGQDSSIIIFIERKDDLMKLHLVKSRNSGAGAVLTYRIDLDKGSWTYIEDENSKALLGDNYEANDEVREHSSDYSEDEVF